MAPNDGLRTIRDDLLRYEYVFTTSYDLIIYWAMGAGPDGWFLPLVDLFKGQGLRFDPTNADPTQGQVPVYFLHGALHLVVGGDGVTWKLRSQLAETVLDQFGEPIEGDPQARPLLVTEGSSRDKLRAIEGNDYLRHVLERLRVARRAMPRRMRPRMPMQEKQRRPRPSMTHL